MPGVTEPLGTLANGQLDVTFPVTIGGQTYVIPPNTITVASAIGGSATALVDAFLAVQPAAATGATITATPAGPQTVGVPRVVFTATGSGGTGTYEYRFQQKIAGVWTTVQDYSPTQFYMWNTSVEPAGTYAFQVLVRSAGSTAAFEAGRAISYVIIPTAATGATLTAAPVSPQTVGVPQVVFSATGSGGSGSYEFKFQQKIAGVWTTVQDYSPTASFNWNSSAQPVGTYSFQVLVRSAGSTAAFEAGKAVSFTINPLSATGATITATPASPQTVGIAQVVFDATGIGGTGTYEFKFQQKIAGLWTTVQDYSPTASFNWNSSAQPAGTYPFQVLVRSAGSTAAFEAGRAVAYTINP
jgi:hypothetical protein